MFAPIPRPKWYENFPWPNATRAAQKKNNKHAVKKRKRERGQRKREEKKKQEEPEINVNTMD